ncbi:signal recognition particle 14 kDa protein [Tanacetum coccineum]
MGKPRKKRGMNKIKDLPVCKSVMFNRNGSLTYSIFYIHTPDIAHGLFSRKPAHALCSVLNPFLPGKRSCVGTRRQEDLELPVPEEDIPNLGGTFGAFIQWPNGAIARFSQSGEVSLSIPGPVDWNETLEIITYASPEQVGLKDHQRFQASYATILKGPMTSLKKRERRRTREAADSQILIISMKSQSSCSVVIVLNL